MPPKKRILKLNGDKLSAVEDNSKEVKQEKKSTSNEGAEAGAITRSQLDRRNEASREVLDGLFAPKKEEKRESEVAANMMEGLSLSRPKSTMEDEVFEEDMFRETGDEALRSPVFLERDPNAEIFDGGSPDCVEKPSVSSPPRGSPPQQAEMFQSIIQAAQAQVAEQAKVAMEAISRNLREVTKRNLEIMERELVVREREAGLERREKERRWRDEMPRNEKREVPMDWSWSRGGVRAGGRAKRPRLSGMFDRTLVQDDMPLGVVPLVNKRGKRSFMFVDDVSQPLDKDGFIREFYPTNMEAPRWLHKGPDRLGKKMSRGEKILRMRRFQNQEPMPDLESDSDNNEDWRKPNHQAPQGRGPGGRKGRGRGRWARRFRPRETCNPKQDQGPARKDDDEGPPEQREVSGRFRCHSNVFIRQNVNVK